MADATITLKPAAPLTHQELLIDFSDFPPNSEVIVNVAGPIAQPYWTTLKTDGFGQCQLFWRTQAPGEYLVKATTRDDDDKQLKETAKFTVRRQPGEIYDEAPTDTDVKTVEEPGVHGDPSSAEVRADPYDPELDRPEQVDPAFEPAQPISTREGEAPKPAARRKSSDARKGK